MSHVLPESAVPPAAEPQPQKKGSPRQAVGVVGAIALLNTLAVTWLIPRVTADVIKEARVEWKEDIQEHSAHPHPDAISRAEYVAALGGQRAEIIAVIDGLKTQVSDLKGQVSDLAKEVRDLSAALRDR